MSRLDELTAERNLPLIVRQDDGTVTQEDTDGSCGPDPLDIEGMGRYQKRVPTPAVRMKGPFVVKTVHEGRVLCEDGWLAIDAHGYPYPIAAGEFDTIYEPIVGTADRGSTMSGDGGWELGTATVGEQAACVAWMLGWEKGYVRLGGLFCRIGRVPVVAGRLREARREGYMGLPSDGWSTVLWCWVAGADQCRRAARFRPLPSVALRIEGSSQRLLLWALQESVGFQAVGPANRKIAYALRAPQNRSEPEDLRVPLPGGWVCEGRKRPVRAVTTRLEVTTFTCRQVVEGLREPPPRDAWRRR